MEDEDLLGTPTGGPDDPIQEARAAMAQGLRERGFLVRGREFGAEFNRRTVRGVAKAGEEIARAGAEGFSWLARKTGLGEKLIPGFDKQYDTAVKEAEGGQTLTGLVTGEKPKPGSSIIKGSLVSDADAIRPKSDSMWWEMYESAVQFMAPFALGGGFGSIAKGLTVGATVDAVAFDPFEANLPEFLVGLADQHDLPKLKAVASTLTVDTDDGVLEARLKRAAAGAMPGAMLDLIGFGFRTWRARARVKAKVPGAEKELAASREALTNEISGTKKLDGPVQLDVRENVTTALRVDQGLVTRARKKAAAIIAPELDVERRAAERLASSDPLTGLANRRALDEALPAAEADPAIQVLVFDANNFGQVNKISGQAAGDEMLQQAGAAIRQAADEAGMGERVFRRGGDEFVVLAPADQVDAIRGRAEELFGDRPVGDVQVSLTGTAGDTFAEADAALQGAKAKRKTPPGGTQKPAGDGPVFESRVEAEEVARTMNERFKEESIASANPDKLSTEEIASINEYAGLLTDAFEGGNKQAQELLAQGSRLNLAYTGGPGRIKAMIETLNQMLEVKAPKSVRSNAVTKAMGKEISTYLLRSSDPAQALRGALQVRTDGISVGSRLALQGIADRTTQALQSWRKAPTPELEHELRLRVAEMYDAQEAVDSYLTHTGRELQSNQIDLSVSDIPPGGVGQKLKDVVLGKTEETRKPLGGLVDELAKDAKKQQRELDRALRTQRGGVAPNRTISETVGPVTSFMEQSKQIRNKILGMDAREIHAVARAVEMAKGNPVNLFKIARQFKEVTKSGVMPKLNSYFMWSLLSKPATFFSAMLSGGGTTAWESAVKTLGGAVHAARSGGDTRALREAVDFTKTVLSAENISESFRAAKMAFAEGHSMMDPRPVGKAFTNKVVQKIASLPSDALQANDEFWKMLNYRALVRARAIREAPAGLSPDAIQKFVIESVDASFDKKTGIALLPEFLEEAGIPTFSNPLPQNSFGRHINNMVTSLENSGSRFILPFVRASANTMRFAAEHTPAIGLLARRNREALAQGGEAASRVMARQVMAATALTGAGMMYKAGLITGRAPDDPKLRQSWLAMHPPYSIKTPAGWVSYRRMEPAGTLISAMADLSQLWESGDVNDFDKFKATSSVVAAFTDILASKTYGEPVFDLLSGLADRDEAKLASWGDRTLGTLYMPLIGQAVNPDPVIREVETTMDHFYRKIPGFSKDLPPKTNFMGEPITPGLGGASPGGQVLQRIFNPLTVTPTKQDVVMGELERLGTGISAPDKRRGQVWLTDPKFAKNGKSAHQRLMEIISESGLRTELEARIKDADYKELPEEGIEFGMPGGAKIAALQNIVSEHYTEAEEKLLEEYPDLANALEQSTELRQMIRGGESTQGISPDILNLNRR